MGAYLSEPMKATTNEDGAGNKLRYGASTMQGWRASQEDAHNCVAQFDEKSSFYGVYDGHGGAEVAMYVAQHFPDLLKNTEAYLDGNIEKAFIEAYLKMDANIKEPEVLKEIRRLAKLADGGGDDSGEAGVDFEEENVSELCEEATMPLDELVAKYQTAGDGGGSASVKQDDTTAEEKPCSSSKLTSPSRSSSSSRLLISPSKTESGSSSATKSELETTTTTVDNSSMPASSSSSNGVIISNGNTVKVEEKAESLTASDKTLVPESSNSSNKSNGEEEEGNVLLGGISHCNGNGIELESMKEEATQEDKEKDSITDSKNSVQEAAPAEVEEESGVKEPTPPVVTPKKKGKVHPVPIVLADITDNNKKVPKRETFRKASLAGLMAFAHDEDSSDFDSSDEDAPVPPGSSNSDDDDSDADSDQADSDDSDDDDEDEEEEEDDRFLNGMQEPGFDSGTTAVVSFLRWENDKLNLWVANAGDSRCVVSRKGTAIDMSYDHKPESEEETLRIVKAGGKVTDDGRVNGGLNLSRALGDHTYKQNESLSPEEQMISPLPNVKHLELNPAEDDEFVVLACDGVWNSMTSQEVVDFVKERIGTSPSLSKICEELFENCLAEDTCGDGTGCDNMTAIIVQLSRPSAKRTMEDDDATESSSHEPTKRLKLDTLPATE